MNPREHLSTALLCARSRPLGGASQQLKQQQLRLKNTRLCIDETSKHTCHSKPIRLAKRLQRDFNCDQIWDKRKKVVIGPITSLSNQVEFKLFFLWSDRIKRNMRILISLNFGQQYLSIKEFSLIFKLLLLLFVKQLAKLLAVI